MSRSDQAHFLSGIGAMTLTAIGSAMVLFAFLSWILGSAPSCPADTGTVPATMQDGRVRCVVPTDRAPD